MDKIKKLPSHSIIIILGIVAVSLNLRTPLTSVGPIITELIDKFNINTMQAGLITTIPLLAFGILSIFTPKLSERIGLEKVILLAMILISIGLISRITGSLFMLYAGTLFIGIAIAVGNVLMPAFIKQTFPYKMGLITGIYSFSMNISGAMASAYSVQIGKWSGWGWKASLGIWSITALIAIIVWFPNIISKKIKQVQKDNQKNAIENNGLATVLKSRLAWQIAIFMGLQSCLFYILVAWLPTILQDWGMSKEASGWTFSYIQLSQIPLVFIGPILITKINNKKLINFTAFILLLGILGILLFKTNYIIISVILIGIGTGLSFSLAMMFFVLKTKTPSQTAQLSGMAQSIGYLIAAIAPPIFAKIFDLTGNWIYALCLLIPITLVLFLMGRLISEDRPE